MCARACVCARVYPFVPPLCRASSHRNANIAFACVAGNVCQGEHPDTAIPLFEDLLKQLPDTVLNIDLKRGTKELVELVCCVLLVGLVKLQYCTSAESDSHQILLFNVAPVAEIRSLSSIKIYVFWNFGSRKIEVL